MNQVNSLPIRPSDIVLSLSNTRRHRDYYSDRYDLSLIDDDSRIQCGHWSHKSVADSCPCQCSNPGKPRNHADALPCRPPDGYILSDHDIIVSAWANCMIADRTLQAEPAWPSFNSGVFGWWGLNCRAVPASDSRPAKHHNSSFLHIAVKSTKATNRRRNTVPSSCALTMSASADFAFPQNVKKSLTISGVTGGHW